MNEFKDLLQKRRRELKITQLELAERLNVSDKTISKWETGRSYPDITMLATLSKALNIDVNNLINCEDFQNEENIERYNYKEINKYKIKIIVSIALLFSFIYPFIASNVDRSNSNKVIGFVSLTLMLISYAVSIIIVIASTFQFRSFIKEKYYQKSYNITLYNYLLSYIQGVLALLFTIPLTYIYDWIRYSHEIIYSNGKVVSDKVIDTIGESRAIINYIILFFLLISPIAISILFKKTTKCKIKLDTINFILFGISLIFFAIGLFYSLKEQGAYSLLFIPTFIFNVIITRRIKYIN